MYKQKMDIEKEKEERWKVRKI